MRLLAAEQILCSRRVHMDYAQLSIFLSEKKIEKVRLKVWTIVTLYAVFM
jgi:hypothetical protein